MAKGSSQVRRFAILNVRSFQECIGRCRRDSIQHYGRAKNGEKLTALSDVLLQFLLKFGTFVGITSVPKVQARSRDGGRNEM